ncbi:hypothetical protein SPBR_06273 [Sporothrix brasiliensis 5110]|uniref:Uncharacterized protein n=1 Tax=Sporothrix brasiliensis 5110 TaxID=1398154 RepID=A0A0C2F555_9PEZI|nr:uncharacterized protein SPBR_06273 [Sporothrix brasiliensis 5110]KIH94049.1 hypothetical protein SPBR_06273 [Sporothrix brasiliensis 5110]
MVVRGDDTDIHGRRQTSDNADAPATPTKCKAKQPFPDAASHDASAYHLSNYEDLQANGKRLEQVMDRIQKDHAVPRSRTAVRSANLNSETGLTSENRTPAS